MAYTISDITKAAANKTVTVRFLNRNHIQIIGKLTVNYYPNSKQLTAYVKGTTKGIHNVTPEKAVRMALVPPPLRSNVGVKRKTNTRRRKMRLLWHHPYCHWCGRKLDKTTATLEHIVPLARGGLDHMNNCTLACFECNQKRGSDMPEVK